MGTIICHGMDEMIRRGQFTTYIKSELKMIEKPEGVLL